MDSVRCIEPEALDEVLASRADDPRRLHLASCPRCAALAGNYELFLAPPDEHPAQAREAEAALTAFRESLLGPVLPAVPPALATGVPKREPKSWWRVLFAPAVRPAWAFAALAIIAGGWYVSAHHDRAVEPGGIQMRGALHAELALSAPAFAPDGSVTLAWQAHPEADGYEVRIYSTSLTELARLPEVTSPMLRIPADRLPAAPTPGDVLLYRVAAIHGGDVVGLSPVGTLQRR